MLKPVGSRPNQKLQIQEHQARADDRYSDTESRLYQQFFVL
jgi:hypothetical protein